MNTSRAKSDFQPQACAKPVKDFQGRIALAALDVAEGMDGESGQLREILLGNTRDLTALFEQGPNLREKGSGSVVFH